MNIDAPVLKDHIEKQNHFVEVINAEKLLWALIHSKGLLHTDVQDLYRKARAGYENIIVNDHEIELQDVEYYLWKLHYKHIDEYRKRIRQSPGNLQNSIDSHMEGFKSFLSEATEFYKDLIAKIKICCGLPEEPLYKKDGDSFSVKSTKLHKFQYVLHRFLVCLGDLARYRELCKKTDIQNHKWSVAATYYLKATMVWPDSGNPQNQLALLATYIGDDFLALYHCVRSLAVKEPFPDAWDNLMLLFEKNTSSHFHSLSSEAQFDFLKPSERSSSNDNKLEGSTEHVSSGKSELWPLFVRMISFFFMKSSLEDFPCAFSSTMREFEVLLALDDTKLKAVLEAYEHLDSARSGPYRALQLVSVLIFIIHSLSESPESKEPKEKNDIQQFALTQLAWIATFICMGRLVERCLKGNHPSCCPFLGAVLVFVEWLVDMLDKAETYSDDERVSSAISYFFGAFGDFLNRIDIKQGEVEPLDRTALWEDYELRGFSPIVNAHISLNFSTHWESLEDYDSKYLSRAHRILFAAMKFVENSSDSRKWISYDKSRRKFYATESIKNQYEHECGAANEYANDVPFPRGESAVVEEEEVILFKPITRYNSVPLQTSTTTNDEMSIIEGTRDQTESSDECIRRATSLRCNKPFKQQEPLLKDSATYPVGPPSLSAWVLNRENPNMGREKGTRDFSKLELSPIKEITCASLSGLSINDSKNSLMDTSPYVAPLPSAPLLPDDAVWFRGNSSGSSDCINEADGILGAPPVRGYSHWPANPGPLDFTPGIPGFIDGYPPLQRMSSSEWLYQYTNSHNLERANNHMWPVHFNPPGNFYGHDGSRFDLFDRWGNPLISNRIVYLEGPQLESPVYGADEQRREKLFLDYQRLNPYGCGAGTELRAEQPPLLQYLKEREWQLERESQLRGPPYMGN